MLNKYITTYKDNLISKVNLLCDIYSIADAEEDETSFVNTFFQDIQQKLSLLNEECKLLEKIVKKY